MVAFGEYEADGTASTLKERDYKDHTDLIARPIAFDSKRTICGVDEDLAPTLRAMSHSESHSNAGGQIAVAFQERGREGGRHLEWQDEIAYGLNAPNGGGRRNEMNIAQGVTIHGTDKTQTVASYSEVSAALRSRTPGMIENSTTTVVQQPLDADTRWAVRRLMPIECERLMGFPDNYTLIPWRGGLAADAPRYKALGNAMAVNVMRWLGTRIQMVEQLGREAA